MKIYQGEGPRLAARIFRISLRAPIHVPMNDCGKGGGMPKRWKVLQWGALGAFCGLCYSAFINFSLLPYTFESADMIAYLSSGFVSSIGTGAVIFAAAAIIRNFVIRLRTR